MAEFRPMIVTTKGQELIAKMLSGGGSIEFTKIETTSTSYTDEKIIDLTSLDDVKQTSLISKVTKTNDVVVQIESSVTNAELTTGYYLNTIALYAKDDEGEVLYAACGAIIPGWMPPYNGVSTTGASFKLVTTVSNAENVTIEVDPAAVATIADVNEVSEKIDNHINVNVLGENGSHGIRYVDGTLQVKSEDGKWVGLKQIEDIKNSVQSLTNSEVELTSTLVKGQTSLSFTDDKINSSSTIDVYSSVYGVSPKNMSISDNTLTLIFKAQESDVDVKVVIS